MTLLSRILSGLRNLWHRQRVERDVDDELRSYVDQLSDEYRAAGGSAADAARAARVAIGGVQQVKEQVVTAKAGAWVEALWLDVRFGARLLGRSPSFAAAAILSLALGIGANSAVFGLLNAIRLRNLPVPHAEELAGVRLDGARCCRHTGRNRQVSLPLWEEIRRQQQAFSQLFAFADTRFNLAAQGEVRYVEALYVSGDFFQVLGVGPAIGRTIGPGDDRAGCTNAGAVISHALWQREFGGRADILSQTLRSQHPIVGVMPAAFFGVEVGRRFDVALPLCASGYNRRDHWWLAVMGRLKPGWTAAQASAHFATLGPSLLRAVVPPDYNAEQTRMFEALQFSIAPAGNGVSPLRADYAQPLWLLLAIAGLVLVTACANVASLSLVRTTARESELALRLALGAAKSRIVRQFFVEGLLIALAGTAAGIAVAGAAHDAILALLSTPTDPIVLDANLDWRSIGFTAMAVGITTLAFALAPALRVRRGIAAAGSLRTTHGTHAVAAREALVSLQVALSVVLVSSAMVFIMTSRNLLAAEAGFNPSNLLVANVFLADSAHPPETRAAVRTSLTARLASIPGVTAAAFTSTPPLSGSSWDSVVGIPGPAGERRVETNRAEISDGYFRAMEIQLLAGRVVRCRRWSHHDEGRTRQRDVRPSISRRRGDRPPHRRRRAAVRGHRRRPRHQAVPDARGVQADRLYGGLAGGAGGPDDPVRAADAGRHEPDGGGGANHAGRVLTHGGRPLRDARRHGCRVGAAGAADGQAGRILRPHRAGARRGWRLRRRRLQRRKPAARDRDPHRARRARLPHHAHRRRTHRARRRRRSRRRVDPDALGTSAGGVLPLRRADRGSRVLGLIVGVILGAGVTAAIVPARRALRADPVQALRME